MRRTPAGVFTPPPSMCLPSLELLLVDCFFPLVAILMVLVGGCSSLLFIPFYGLAWLHFRRLLGAWYASFWRKGWPVVGRGGSGCRQLGFVFGFFLFWPLLFSLKSISLLYVYLVIGSLLAFTLECLITIYIQLIFFFKLKTKILFGNYF